MLTEKQKSLLAYIKDVPEWQSALIYDQLAELNRTASALSDTVERIEHGFASSVLRPDRYFFKDPDIQRDFRSDTLDRAVSSLGTALAALEILTVLSDAYQSDRQHAVEYAHDMHYNELEKLCIKHGYQEDNT